MAILKVPVVIDGVKCIEELVNRVLNEYEYHGRTIREWADLISEIPPHGRLIDADALIADLKRQCKEVFRIDAVSPDDFWITRNEAYNERLWTTWCESLGDYINTAPTVIEADYPPSTPFEQVWTEVFGEDGE